MHFYEFEAKTTFFMGKKIKLNHFAKLIFKMVILF